MRRILLLHCEDSTKGRARGFPEKLDSVPWKISPSGQKCNLPRHDVEEAILTTINKFNSSLGVCEIEYVDLKTEFPNAKTGVCTGLIVDESEIDESEINFAVSNGCYIFHKNNSVFARQIFAYVFISPTSVGARNSFVSQTIFPELFDYIGTYLSSPSFELANKPIFFLNIVYNPITPDSILRNLAGLELMGVKYMECYGPTFNPAKDIPTDFEQLVDKYYKLDKNGKCDWFQIDFKNRKFKILMDRFVIGEYLEPRGSDCVGFHGSAEKFFVINMLPIAIRSIREGYDVDIKEFAEFCENKGVRKFGDEDEKFPRVVTVCKYLQKLINQRR